ncbi:MAG: hypothetical protein HY341_00410 [Candidatus Kerfeldbacteria bacterium]|nr:hypothetical protein [Candidatus Kerfeldbacteria bacterium]
MRNIIKNRFAIFELPLARAFLLSALLFNVVTWIVTARSYSPTEDFVPLHYTIYFGIDLFGPWQYLYTYAAWGAVIVIVNTVIASLILRRHQALALLFTGVTPVLLLFLGIGLAMVVTQLL